MVVEDDPDAMTITSTMLTIAGYHVLQASSGANALSTLRSQKVDLVLTDMAMPGMSGVDVIAAIRADPFTRKIPVIAMTALRWEELTQSVGQVDCNCHLDKPMGKDLLLREIEKQLLPDSGR